MSETGWVILAMFVVAVVARVVLAWLRVRRELEGAERVGLGWSYANAELVKHAEGLQAELRAVRQSAEAILLERNALAKRLGRLERGVGGPKEGGEPADIAAIKRDPAGVGVDPEIMPAASAMGVDE